MRDSNSAFQSLLGDLVELIAPGRLGFYNGFEVTEIIGMRAGVEQPFNVLTLICAEEDVQPRTPKFLGDRIKVPRMRGVKFGVARYAVSVEKLSSAIKLAGETGKWQPCGAPLTLDHLTYSAPVLVPSDGRERVPLNGVLKNNFWDGAHVLELFDDTKTLVADLIRKPSCLMALAEEVLARTPIHLAGLSDRLGNVVIQLPVDVIRTKSRYRSAAVELSVAWHPKAESRPLLAHAIAQRDGVISAYNVTPLSGDACSVQVGPLNDPYSIMVWDEKNGAALAASGPQMPILQANVGTSVMSPPSRLVTLADGSHQRIELKHAQAPNAIGTVRPRLKWATDRLYETETSNLARTRQFRQYCALGPQQEDRADAYADLRFLIERHGEHGVWLWDPYLSGADILQTLFFNPYAHAPMRALASASRAAKNDNASWIAQQAAHLSNCNSNYEGLKLEYRALNGNAGWDFHDRFLIFPGNEGRALAWSLGISVNQAGGAHHILQRVDNGRLVAEAFDQLWNELGADQLVWSWLRTGVLHSASSAADTRSPAP